MMDIYTSSNLTISEQNLKEMRMNMDSNDSESFTDL